MRLKIKEVVRQEEAPLRRFVEHVVRAALLASLCFFVELGISSVVVLAPPFGTLLSRQTNPASYMALAFILSAGALLGLMVFWKAGKEILESFDRVGVRLLSISSRGLSELIGPLGSGIGYFVTIIVAFAAATWYTSAAISGSDPAQEALEILKGIRLDFSSPSRSFKGAAILIGGAFLWGMPLRMTLSPRWWTFLQAPKLEPWTKPSNDDEPFAQAKQLRIAHASDVHAGGGTQHFERQHQSIRRLIRRAGACSDLSALVISGDITDDGLQDSWNILTARGIKRNLVEKMVVVPGNHDLNLYYEGWLESFVNLEGPWRTGAHGRALRYLRFATKVMGDRALVVCPFTGGVASLRSVMERAAPAIDRWDEHIKPLRHDLLPAELVERLFPMLVTVIDVEDAAFFVWNSVKANKLPAANAIGEVSAGQFERADKLIAHLGPAAALVHVMHHQVGMPIQMKVSRAQDQTLGKRFFGAGMALQNPAQVLDWIGRRSQKSVMLHGHHHKLFALRHSASGTDIVSAASLTMGCEESYLPADDPIKAGKWGSWLELDIRITGANSELSDVTVQKVPRRRSRI